MQNQLIKYLIIAAIGTIVALILFLVVIPEQSSWAVYATPSFFASISIIVHLIITRPTYTKFAKFSAMFMLSSVVKLLLYFAFLLAAYTHIASQTRISFVVFFMAIYLLFAIADTMFMLNFFRKKDRKIE